MEHMTMDQSYLLGELIAVGELLEISCYGTEHSSLCLKKDSSFLKFEEYFPLPLYLKKLEKLECILEKNGHKALMEELYIIYNAMDDKCSGDFPINQENFFSGYYFQRSLHGSFT